MKDFMIKHKTDLFYVGLFLLVLILFRLVIINAYIPSESMENTLMTKDRIIGLRLTKEFKRGDVAIFHYDEDNYYIKRIIGVGGDRVLIKDNKVFINGKELKEPYLREPMITEDAEYYVPEGSYFFLGDNRNDSKDSRFWDNPFRTQDDMVAKAVFRYWPLNKMKIIQ